MTLGAISVDDISLREDLELIPQSFIGGQLQIIRKKVENEFNLYSAIKPATSLKGITVILVDDGLLDTIKSLLVYAVYVNKSLRELSSLFPLQPNKTLPALPKKWTSLFFYTRTATYNICVKGFTRSQRLPRRLPRCC